MDLKKNKQNRNNQKRKERTTQLNNKQTLYIRVDRKTYRYFKNHLHSFSTLPIKIKTKIELRLYT